MSPNTQGRVVYLPEKNCCELRFNPEGEAKLRGLPEGDQYIPMPLDELVVFSRPNTLLPLGPGGMNSQEAQAEVLTLLGLVEETATLVLWEDDGESPETPDLAMSRLTITLTMDTDGPRIQGSLDDPNGLCTVKRIQYSVLNSDGRAFEANYELADVLRQ
jgi:alpha-glucosidase